jgi:putative Mg2+ transporter-C (MgtC) family protein
MQVCFAAIFRDTWTADEFGTVVIRLAAAAILGAILGFERQREGKSAGMRTHMLVCLGAALFAVGPSLGDMDPASLSRVIQGIATGVGFLGAGSILKANDQQQIRGLTTAASIWVTAGAGVALGAGYLLGALTAVALAWLILYPIQMLEMRFYPHLGPKPAEERRAQGD